MKLEIRNSKLEFRSLLPEPSCFGDRTCGFVFTILAILTLGLLPGCVHRRLTINSNPPGESCSMAAKWARPRHRWTSHTTAHAKSCCRRTAMTRLRPCRPCLPRGIRFRRSTFSPTIYCRTNSRIGTSTVTNCNPVRQFPLLRDYASEPTACVPKPTPGHNSFAAGLLYLTLTTDKMTPALR